MSSPIPNPLTSAQSDASHNASHHELKLPGYHLFETKYDSPLLLNHSLPPGSRLYTGPLTTDKNTTDNNNNVHQSRQVGFLIIPPAFHPQEVALSIENATSQQFIANNQEHYALTNNGAFVRDHTGVFPTRRISPIQPLVALNVPTTVHGRNIPDAPTMMIPNIALPLLLPAGLIAMTSFFSTRELHRNFAKLIATPTQSPQQYASRVLNAMKTSLLGASTSLQLAMPVVEVVMASTAVCALLNRYRTRSIIETEFKRTKDAERKLQLAPSIVSPLIIAHPDQDYNIHPSAMAFLGDISYHPDLSSQHEQSEQAKLENKFIIANANNTHSALCNVALDVPQPLPTTTNMLFDCFDRNGDLLKAFSGEVISAERSQGEFLKAVKTRQREGTLLQHLPLFFSKIPDTAYQGLLGLLAVSWGVTRFSQGLQKMILNRISTRGSMVLRNIYLENQHQATSMRLPPTFMNQVIHTHQSSVLFPALARTKKMSFFRAFVVGLFTAYCYKLVDQTSVIGNHQEYQQYKPRCTTVHHELPTEVVKVIQDKMIQKKLDDDTKAVLGTYPVDSRFDVADLAEETYGWLETINFSHQAGHLGPQATSVIDVDDVHQVALCHELNLKQRNSASNDARGGYKFEQKGNAALTNDRVIPHLSIKSPEALQYTSILTDLIPEICSTTRPAIATKLIDEWLPAQPNEERMMGKHVDFLKFFDQTYQNKRLYPYSIDQMKFAESVDSVPGKLQLTNDPKRMKEVGEGHLDDEKTSVVTRSFWSIDLPPLPSVLLTTPSDPSTFSSSLHALLATYYSKYSGIGGRAESVSESQEKEQDAKILLNNALHTPEPYGNSFLSTLKRITKVLMPLPFSKPVLPDGENEVSNMPHPLDYSFQGKAPIRQLFSTYPDYSTYNRPLNDLSLSEEEIEVERTFDHKMKGSNTSLVRVAGVTSQTMFQFVLATTLLTVPFYLTMFEYYHQKNLSYLTHSFGIPNVSEIATPGMVTSTQAKASIPPWLLTKGMQHNSQRLFGLYNSMAAFSSSARQMTSLLFNAFGPIKATESSPSGTSPESVSRSYGVPGGLFKGSKRVMLNLSFFGKICIPLVAMVFVANAQFETLLNHVRKASTPSFPDGRNGVTTDALLLSNSNLVFFDKQSAHNIKIKSHLEQEKRRQKEKMSEKKNQDDIAKFGPQQAVKRLFDNALKRSKEQSKQEDVKKREEEFEAKLDENGELKLTRKQVLVKWIAYYQNLVKNVLFIEPKSCEKKFSLNVHNTASAITSHGLMLVLLQEHLRKQFIEKMQAKFDEDLKEKEGEEVNKSDAKTNDQDKNHDKNDKNKNDDKNDKNKKDDKTKIKKIEDDPRYPKQPSKPPNFRYTHVLQKSNTFMLLDQQDIHNEFEYVYHILHKKYKKAMSEKLSESKALDQKLSKNINAFNIVKVQEDVLDTINQVNGISEALSSLSTSDVDSTTSSGQIQPQVDANVEGDAAQSAKTEERIDVVKIETTKDDTKSEEKTEEKIQEETEKTPVHHQPEKIVFGTVKKGETAASLAANAPLGIKPHDRSYSGIPMYYVTSPL